MKVKYKYSCLLTCFDSNVSILIQKPPAVVYYSANIINFFLSCFLFIFTLLFYFLHFSRIGFQFNNTTTTTKIKYVFELFFLTSIKCKIFLLLLFIFLIYNLFIFFQTSKEFLFFVICFNTVYSRTGILYSHIYTHNGMMCGEAQKKKSLDFFFIFFLFPNFLLAGWI